MSVNPKNPMMPFASLISSVFTSRWPSAEEDSRRAEAEEAAAPYPDRQVLKEPPASRARQDQEEELLEQLVPPVRLDQQVQPVMDLLARPEQPARQEKRARSAPRDQPVRRVRRDPEQPGRLEEQDQRVPPVRQEKQARPEKPAPPVPLEQPVSPEPQARLEPVQRDQRAREEPLDLRVEPVVLVLSLVLEMTPPSREGDPSNSNGPVTPSWVIGSSVPELSQEPLSK